MAKQRVGSPRLQQAAIAHAVAVLFAMAGVAPAPAQANPTGAQVVSGTVSVNTPAAGQMTINQYTPNAIVNWNTFSIGAGEAVRIVQPTSASALLNRVTGAGPSVIGGQLLANGRVFLINPAGVLFAPGSSVNVGSMVASTLDISDADFSAGKYHFIGSSTATVANAGTLSAQDGGTIALLGGSVSNSGTVSARLGTVAMGAGSDITLDFAGDGLTTLSINQGAAKALVANTGTLAADGGTVVMSAQTADALAGMVLNQQGVVRAASIGARNGHIYLDGGTAGVTQVGGTLDATGGAGSTGGRIDVTGYDVALVDQAVLDASGALGGGVVNVGGGSAGLDSTVRDANALWIAPTAVVRADATDIGNGGNVVAYATSVARLYGTLTTLGGPKGGNGGKIETSSQVLDMNGLRVDASAPLGTGGTWLLDPYEIDIVSTISPSSSTGTGSLSTGTNTDTYGPYFFSGANNTTDVLNTTINNDLNNGTSVTIATAPTNVSTGIGNIGIDAPISKTAGGDATLTLSASGSILDNTGNAITSTAGKLNVVMDANVGAATAGNQVIISPSGSTLATMIQTNGGNLSIGTNSGTAAVSISTSMIDTTAGALPGGSVTINGTGSAGSDGIDLTNSAVTSGSGNVTLSGSAGAAAPNPNGLQSYTYGVNIQNSPIATTDGSISVSGLNSDTTGAGGNFGVAISGFANGATPALGSSGKGSITVSGNATSAVQAEGVSVTSAQFSTASGSINVSGTATDAAAQAYAVFMLGVTMTSSNGGSVGISGSASGLSATALELGNASGASTTTGSINISGTASGTAGAQAISLGGGNYTTSAGGQISVSGVANGPQADAVDMSSSLTTGAGGDISVTGAATGTTGASAINLDSGSVSTIGGGNILFSGTATAPGGNASALSAMLENIVSDTGTVTLSGNASAGQQASGVSLVAGTIGSSTGAISISSIASGGTANAAQVNPTYSTSTDSGPIFTTSTAPMISSAGGAISVSGTATGTGGGATGIDLAPSASIVNTTGTIALSGNASDTAQATGVVLPTDTITATTGNISVTGTASAPLATGLSTSGSTVISTLTGSISVAGSASASQSLPATTSSLATGVSLSDTTLSSSGGGAIALTGTATDNGTQSTDYGINALSTSLTTTGSISVSGSTSGSGYEIGTMLSSSVLSTATGGITVQGMGTGGPTGEGVYATSTTMTTAGGPLSVTGTGTGTTTAAGMFLFSDTLSSTASDAITITGTSNGAGAFGSGDGILTSATNIGTAGNLVLNGTATGAGYESGLSLNDSTLAVSSTGNLTLQGTASGGIVGTGVSASGTNLAVAAGILSTSGAGSGSTSGTGVSLASASMSSSAGGAVSVTGTANAPAVASTGGIGSYGVQLTNGASITTGSGALTVTGTAPASVTGSAGVDLAGASLGSSSGTITVTGQSSGTPSAASVQGVILESVPASFSTAASSPASITTGSGALHIDGSGSGDAAAGIYVADGSSIASTNGGVIDLRGAVAGPSASGTSNSIGVLIQNGSITASGPAGAGDTIAINGSTNTADPGIALGAVPSPSSAHVAGPVTISSLNPGTIALRAGNNGTASSLVARTATISSPGGVLAVMPGTVNAGNGFTVTSLDSTPITLFGTGAGLSIDTQTFAAFGSTFDTMVFGSNTQTGEITVNGQGVAGALTRPTFQTNLTLSNPGAGSQGIALPNGIQLPGKTLALISAGPVTDPGGIVASSLLLSGPGNFTLTDPQNVVGTLAINNAGNVNFYDSTGLTIGAVTARTYTLIGNTSAPVSVVDSTLTGNLVAQAGTGNVTLGTSSQPSNLTAGGSIDLLMEQGVFNDAGGGAITAGTGWRIWAMTWNGETRGSVQPGGTLPNFYGCTFGSGCSWGGVIPATGNHYIYADQPVLTITADSVTRFPFQPNPPLGYTISGSFINGDSPSTLTGSVQTAAGLDSPIGTYATNPVFASSIGYKLLEVPGTLTIFPSMQVMDTGLQSFFGNEEKTFVYENNLQGTNVCMGASAMLFQPQSPDAKQDLLAVEWKRVRQQPNLNACMRTDTEHGCSDF